VESRAAWKSDLARREVKSIWKGQKAGMLLSQPQRDKTAHLFFFNIYHLNGCGGFDIYIAKIAQWLKCLMTVFMQQGAL